MDRSHAAHPLDLLVIGDANPDLILRGGDVEPAFGQHEHLVEHASMVLGGSGAIMAAGAARLGLRTGMAGAVGDDVLSQFVLAELAAAGVDTSAVGRVPGVPTGISVALARPDDRAVLTAPGALDVFDPARVPDALLERTAHVHIASPFLQPMLLRGLGALIARAHAAGARVSVDTGWDPRQRWSTAAAAAVTADVLLPNGQEAIHLAAALAGPAAAAGPLEAARILAARGPLVVVKAGAHGALAVRGTTVVRGQPYRLDTVDATGAGDSFDAGFLAGWLGAGPTGRAGDRDGEPGGRHGGAGDLAYALALGCACGALSTRCAGGTAGQPTRAEAEALIATGSRQAQ